MPKILFDAKERIIESAKSELFSNGGTQLSMRSVAEKAGVAVGTLYHYFVDKISLIATIILTDWEHSYKQAEEKIKGCASIDELIDLLYKLVDDFSDEHQEIFNNYKDESFASYYLKLHPSLVGQITSLWQKGLEHLYIKEKEETSILVPEIILIATREKRIKAEALKSMIKKII